MNEQNKQEKNQNQAAGELPHGRDPVNTDFLFEDGILKGPRKKERGHALPVVVMLTSFVLAFVLFLTVLCMPEPVGEAVEETEALTDGRPVLNPMEEEEEVLSTAELYAACAPSVVSILAEGESGKSVGSGFFVTSNGYLATANHVVAGARRLTVYLSGGKQYSAALVAGDERTDLALLKIRAEGLPALTFGSSAALTPGERVVTIGTPISLEYAGSVDSGEVSYPKRTVRITSETDGSLKKKMTLIQTNVSVNPGNSGCPLFNEKGEVVGIVTMKLGDAVEGMAFAIPSDGAKPILEAMREGRVPDEALLSAVSVRAPRLGILGERAREGEVYGVRVARFEAGEHDAMRKLKIGDLILAVEDTPVTSTSELAAAISAYAPGDGIRLTVLRAGQRLTFSVTLSAV